MAVLDTDNRAVRPRVAGIVAGASNRRERDPGVDRDSRQRSCRAARRRRRAIGIPGRGTGDRDNSLCAASGRWRSTATSTCWTRASRATTRLFNTQMAVSALGMGPTRTSITITPQQLLHRGGGAGAVDGAWIGENKLVNTAPARSDTTVGISPATGPDRRTPEQCQVLPNQIEGLAWQGIVIGAPVRDLIVAQHHRAQCGSGILDRTMKTNGGSLSIENNHIRNVDARREGATGLVVGIAVIARRARHHAGNIIRSVGVTAVAVGAAVGITWCSASNGRVSGNEITRA